MKKVVIAMLLVALCVVPAFATPSYSLPNASALVDFTQGKNGLEFKEAFISLDVSFFDTYWCGVNYAFGSEDYDDGYNVIVGHEFADEVTAEAVVNFSEKDFKAESVYFDFSNDSFAVDYKLGYKYSFDKDPAKTGLSFGASYTTDSDFDSSNKHSLSVEGTVHKIDDKLKLEGFEAKYSFRDYLDYFTVAYDYSYDQPAEVNGIYASVAYSTGTDIIFFQAVAEASVHKVDDKIKFEVNGAGLYGCYQPDYRCYLYGTEYVYSFANEAADNGFFGYISYDQVAANFKFEDWKIADWNLEAKFGYER